MGYASNFIQFLSRSFFPHSGPQSTGPGGTSESGLIVTDERAMRNGAAWACIKLYSDIVAALPLDVYERVPSGGRKEATNHPLYRVLKESPNAIQTPAEFKAGMQMHYTSQGNGYAEVVRSSIGEVISLLPLYSNAMSVEVARDGRGLVYKYSTESGQRIYAAEDILHIKGFGPNPYVGLSPLANAREALGIAINIETSTSKFFKNGMRPGGVIEGGDILKPAQREEFRKRIEQQYGGSEKSFQVFVLEAGFKYNPTTLSPEDAQMLEQWSFTITDICRFFGVPPALIGHTDKASSWASSLENLNLFFLQYGLGPVLTRWQEAINKRLLRPEERSKFYVEFNPDALLRADMKTRTEGYAKALGGPGTQGWMAPNEVRRAENMPDIANGDQLSSAVAVQTKV